MHVNVDIHIWFPLLEGQRVHIPVPQWRGLLLFNMSQVLVHLALKGNGRQQSDWFDLCSAQNTHMTNPESDNHLFALHFETGYLPFNSQIGLGHALKTLVRCALDHLNRAQSVGIGTALQCEICFSTLGQVYHNWLNQVMTSWWGGAVQLLVFSSWVINGCASSLC